MSGIIGLTAAGQQLDIYLTKHTPSYSRKLYKFIVKFTKIVKNYRSSLSNREDMQYILILIRNDYLNRLNTLFKNSIEEYPYSLAYNYIYTITKPDFIPTTKTQQSILRKKSTQYYA